MLSAQDFAKKQVAFVFFSDGEKLAVNNSNLVVRKEDGSIKFQCSCYRLFLVFAVGPFTITSTVIQEARRFGFFIALMSRGFRLLDVIGAGKDSNSLLHQKQYQYQDLDIARVITQNKIENQLSLLKTIRDKTEAQKEAIELIQGYYTSISSLEDLASLMAYEGLSSKLYFRNYFTNVSWNGRQPRVKRDYVNSAMDIGYTILFSFIDALLEAYGFDTYRGIMHRQFYMRKSLVCDLVEPFRPIIDRAIKNGINLKQIQEKDFQKNNGQMQLKWQESSRYVKLMMTPLLEYKEEIFCYIQAYYRAFMKGLPGKDFPSFNIGAVK